jgi:hypothetical protein
VFQKELYNFESLYTFIERQLYANDGGRGVENMQTAR